MQLFDWLPHEATDLFFVLFLSFLIGLEREERKDGNTVSFGGVRTFPLIGLIGYAMGALSGGDLLPQALGFAVIASFLLMSYWQKLTRLGYAGITSHMSGLITYLIGALAYRNMFWLATSLTVVALLLLELKEKLEAMAHQIDPGDVLTFSKFLLLAAVILPLVPNAAYTPFQINPFKIWLVVVAVSGVSYGSYLLQRLVKGRGILLSGLLGGAYSSTVTTVALARRSKSANGGALYSGSILIASGMMYLRLVVLLAIFNHELMVRLIVPFIALSILAISGGVFWSHRETPVDSNASIDAHNPLEITSALTFALLFVIMLIATNLAARYLGSTGIYTLAGVMGIADVDPFIMGLTQSAPSLTPISVATDAILIAASSNNVVKGIYAFALSSRTTGRQSLLFLLTLSVLGLLPLLL